MNRFCLLILLTVVLPSIPLKLKAEVIKQAQIRVKNHEFTFQFDSDPAKDTIFYGNIADMKVLSKGQINEITQFADFQLPSDLPSRVKVRKVETPLADTLAPVAVINSKPTIFWPDSHSGELFTRWQLPEVGEGAISLSPSITYKDQKFSVVRIKKAGKLEQFMIRQSDGAAMPLGDNKDSSSAMPRISLSQSKVKINGLKSDFDLERFKTGGDNKNAYQPKADTEVSPADGLARLRQNKNEVAALRSQLGTNIFGQDYALDSIAAQYGEARKNHTGKPKVLVAMGPSGGGKTFTATELAKLLHGGKILEISGNEYRSHAGALEHFKLFGSKSGEATEGSLVKMAKENPKGFTFVINEGEKMNPDIWLMLMEFLDQGKISDPTGKTYQVENLWVVITSNRGNVRMFPPASKEWSQAEVDAHLHEFKQEELHAFFMQKDGLSDQFQLPDEIIKRIDEFVAFGPTTKDAAIKMARKTAEMLNESYKKEFGISLQFDEKTIDQIAINSWRQSNDARTLSRAVRGLMSKIIDQAPDDLHLNGGETITISSETDSRGQLHYVASANGHNFKIGAGVNPANSPLMDSEFRERLKAMKVEMSKLVVGQDAAITDIVDAITSHFGRGKPSRPFSAYLLGPSGNGKTETGRALSQVLYKSDKRYAIIPMGNVSDDDGFGDIFGGSSKYQGGDVERLFEKVLRENPKGAVIVLDEISNMGGGDLNKKSALFKKLYDFLEEGRYISPRDGRVYDLTKYQFILTGNDGEQLFRGVTSDDLLMATWQHHKSLEKVREMMLESGIPNAFINRLNVTALTKPLLRSEVGAVTKKLWERQVQEFVAANPGIQIEASPNLLKQLSQTFFTADQGGRSVRKILEDKVGALLTYALLHTDADYANLSPYKVVVDLADSASRKAYDFIGTPIRKVLFRAAVYKSDQLIDTEQLDVTEVSPARIAMNQRDARITAFHEAGHALANLEEISQERVSFITIRGGSNGKIKYLGYARYEPVSTSPQANPTIEQVVVQIARMYAGSKAQQMAGFPRDAGWAQDLLMMRSLATQALTVWGLDPTLAAVTVSGDGSPMYMGPQAAMLDARLKKLFTQGEALAEQLLMQRWPAVRAVAAELLLRGEIDRAKFVEIKERYKTKDPHTLLPHQQFHSSGIDLLSCRAAFD